MEGFHNFILSFFSIVFGIITAEFLKGISRLVRHKELIKFYWVHAGWVTIAFLLILQNWWGLWQFKTHIGDNFTYFILILINPIIYTISIPFLLPKIIDGKQINFRLYFFENSKIVFTLYSFLVLKLSLDDIVISGMPIGSTENFIRIGAATLLFGLIFVPIEKDWIHKVTIPIAFGLLITFIIFFTNPSLV